MVGGSLRRRRVRGSALAVSASTPEMYFSSAMRSRTWLRRTTTRSGFSMGERRLGFWGRPARRAASARVRSRAGLLKKDWLAASTP